MAAGGLEIVMFSISIAGHLVTALWWILILELVSIGWTIGEYYDPGGNSRAYKNDANAAVVLSWMDRN